jgi:hypothetical protein
MTDRKPLIGYQAGEMARRAREARWKRAIEIEHAPLLEMIKANRDALSSWLEPDSPADILQ